ncbi:MAG: hypothetical protein QM749_19730 [Aquabacterium sp.]
MRTWQWGLIAWIVGSLLALLFALVHPGEGWAAFDRIVQVVSAGSTTAAVVVALRLARQQVQLAEQRDSDRAELVAAGLAPILAGLETDIERLSVALAHRPDVIGHEDLEDLRGIHVRLRYRINSFMLHKGLNIGQDTFIGLMPLPNKAASRMHAVCAMAKSLHDITGETSNPIWGDVSQSMARDHWLDDWYDSVEWMKGQLDIALPEISKAAALGAHLPQKYIHIEEL